MATFSKKSISNLLTCHEDLQKVFLYVVSHYDCTVTQGVRGKMEQNDFYRRGLSKLKYPQSKHNKTPSLAIDVAPYIAGKGVIYDKNQCYNFAGFVLGVASMMGIKVRWGGDWDQDRDINDQSFLDLVHFELI